MKRGVVIILIGLLLLLITGILWVVFRMGLLGGGQGEKLEIPQTVVEQIEILQPAPTPVPPATYIVVAVQDIGRGMEITQDAVMLWAWPVEALPPTAIEGSPEQDYNRDGVPDAVEKVLGKRMRTSAVRFEPILETMIVDNIDLTGTGSDPALSIGPGRVIMALPLPDIKDDPTAAVAYALRVGDHVDVLVSLSLIDLDADFHTKLPNDTLRLNVSQTGTGEQQFALEQFPYGRIEEGPLGLIFNVIPSEDNQRPRSVAQLTVQDAVVIRVGRYPTYEEQIRGIDPQAPPTPTPVPEGGEAVAGPPPAPPMPAVIVLAVTPQDALVLKFAWEIGSNMDYVLRAVGDRVIYQTNAVTLDYLMETYNIPVPPKLQYGLVDPVSISDLVNQSDGQ
jgi:Flp pilus assembly protein CpaB